MFSSTVFIAASGLLALASAAPAVNHVYGTCVNGQQLGVLRFDFVFPGPVPYGYGGFEWNNISIIEGPTHGKDDDLLFPGSSPPDAIRVHNTETALGGGEMTLVQSQQHQNRSTIRFFNAMCFAPPHVGKTPVDCNFQINAQGKSSSKQYAFEYTVPQPNPGFTPFGIDSNPDFYSFSPFVTGNYSISEKPILVIDNMVIQRYC